MISFKFFSTTILIKNIISILFYLLYISFIKFWIKKKSIYSFFFEYRTFFRWENMCKYMNGKPGMYRISQAIKIQKRSKLIFKLLGSSNECWLLMWAGYICFAAYPICKSLLHRLEKLNIKKTLPVQNISAPAPIG